ncbi:CNNM domain-containing protein, partial [Bacillus vallismortis]|nr:CNNM domain-containing protein [Bacillus vallismortis]
MIILQLVAIYVLVGITAFFVAAEFAIVKIRGSKIKQLIESGDSREIAAHKIISNKEEYLSA